MSSTQCLRVIVTGRVQGVYYRAWAVANAKERGLTGWVRNLNDGSVEALFCGPGMVIEEMIKACYEGPPAAKVADIQRHAHEGEIPPDFRQRSNG